MLFMFLAPYSVIAETDMDALKALRKLDAKLEAGISLRDFSLALSDAIFEVNLFLDSPEAVKKKEFAELIKKITGHYKSFKSIAKEELDGPYRTEDNPSATYLFNIAEKYPDAQKNTSNRGAMETSGALNLTYLKRIVGNQAHEDIKLATEMIKKQVPDVSPKAKKKK